jgi:hypothetical protein
MVEKYSSFFVAIVSEKQTISDEPVVWYASTIDEIISGIAGSIETSRAHFPAIKTEKLPILFHPCRKNREAQGPDGFLQLKNIYPGGRGISIKERTPYNL